MKHDTIAELLPWYVNGTLPPHERAAVEAELASCPLCAAELARLQRVHAAMHEIDKDAPGPSETLFARTLARVERESAQPRPFSVLQWWQQLSTAGKVTSLVPAALALIVVIIATRFAFGTSSYVRPGGTALPEQSVATSTNGAPADVYQTKAKSIGVTSRAAAENAAAPAAMPVSGAAGVVQPQATPGSALITLRTFERPQLIRTGSVSLLVPDVEHALNQLSSLAQMQFGDVVSLQDETPSQPGVRHTADVELSIPADRFDATMSALGRIGAMKSRSITAENVSDQIVDARARLRNLRRTEADMLKILDRSGKIPEILDVTQQIADVRQQIEQLDAQLQSLQHRVAYSTISISLEDEQPVASVEPSAGSQLGAAWTAALRSVKNVSIKLASIVLTVVAFAPYWLAIALIALFIANRLRRKTL